LDNKVFDIVDKQCNHEVQRRSHLLTFPARAA